MARSVLPLWIDKEEFTASITESRIYTPHTKVATPKESFVDQTDRETGETRESSASTQANYKPHDLRNLRMPWRRVGSDCSWFGFRGSPSLPACLFQSSARSCACCKIFLSHRPRGHQDTDGSSRTLATSSCCTSLPGTPNQNRLFFNSESTALLPSMNSASTNTPRTTPFLSSLEAGSAAHITAVLPCLLVERAANHLSCRREQSWTLALRGLRTALAHRQL